MNKTTNNLQDLFLNYARKNKITLTVYLTNGFQIRGIVTGFDSFIIVLECDGNKQMMVYKHAVSTITPVTPINLNMQQIEKQGE